MTTDTTTETTPLVELQQLPPPPSPRELLLDAGLITEESSIGKVKEQIIDPEKPIIDPEKKPTKDDKEEPETPEEKKERRQWQKTAKRVKQQLAELEKWEKEFAENPGKALISKGLKLTPKQAIDLLQAHDITVADWARAELESPEKKAQREAQKLIDERFAKLESENKAKEEQIRAANQLQLANAIYSNFKEKSNKYELTSSLLEDGLISADYFHELADQVQEEYNETGIKPDLDVYFKKQEDELQKLLTAINKKKKVEAPTLAEQIKATTQSSVTLSNRSNEVSNIAPKPTNPDEILKAIIEKYK